MCGFSESDKMLYWVWLAEIFGPASYRAVKLIRAVGTAWDVFNATENDLLDTGVFGNNKKTLKEILKHDLSEAVNIRDECHRLGIRILTPDCDEFPVCLLQVSNSPLVLYVRGKLPDMNENCTVSVVGTRNMSNYGKTQAYKIGFELASAGVVVVSGLALGIDGISMAAAMDAGGTVVGIIGAGIDKIYPKQHTKLYWEVLKKGAIISEYPPGVSASKYTFPQRNRIVGAATVATVVVEGKEKSGALITAGCASYHGRYVFAVPGLAGKAGSEGPHRAIRNGAIAVTNAKEILEHFSFLYPNRINMGNLKKGVPDEKWLEIADLSVEEHHVRYKPSEDDAADVKIANIEEAPAVELKKEPVKKTEVPSVSQKDKKAPFNNFINQRKVEKSQRIDFELLGENEKKVYYAMPCDTPLLPEEIHVEGMAVSDILASLTLLEMTGTVEAGAGGYFLRNGEEEVQFTL